MMMSLGLFVFSLPTAAYQELQRKTAWRHVDQARVGARAASQFLGPGADTITLSGTLVPDAGGALSSIADLRAMGDQGEAWAMVAGTGEVMGAWVIENLDESKAVFFEDGVARKTDFSLSLKLVDDPTPAQPAQPVAGATS